MFFQKQFWLGNFRLDNKILLIEYNDVRASFVLFPNMMSNDKGVVNFAWCKIRNVGISEFEGCFLFARYYIYSEKKTPKKAQNRRS